MKAEQDVNEATAALKGLLGLGVPPTENRIKAPTNDDSKSPPTTQAVAQGNNKKKRNNNKKKKGNENVKKDEQKPIKDNYRGDSSTNQKKKNQKNQVAKEPETYALSAFQSSPDASNLPIPEFAAPINEKSSAKPEEIFHPEVHREDSAEEKVNTFEQKLEVNKKSVIEDEFISKNGEKEAEVESRNDAPVSTTGVNLAALAAKPPQNDVPSSSPAPQHPVFLHSMPPQQTMNPPQHLPPPYGAGPTNPHLMPFPHHQHPGFSSPLSPHQYQLPHLHHHPFPPPPPPPPGYILIQVQVPPVLMPGRQMVVTTPAGYPVQVVVPDGVPPLSIMPVHVPAGPPHPNPMHPHPYPIMTQQQPPPPPPPAPAHYDDNSNMSDKQTNPYNNPPQR